VTNTAGDADLPVNTLTFSLVSAPSGVNLDPSSGVLTWTPSEAQGPSTNPITVRVTDNGTPPLSDTKSFLVAITKMNNPPLLSSIPNQVTCPGVLLTVPTSATDVDVPANALTFSLDTGAPGGAFIDPTTGQFAWTPATNQPPCTNMVTVRVTDNGVPQLSDARSFMIVVVSPPMIESIVTANNRVTISWSAATGMRYRVQFKGRLDESVWSDLPGDVAATESIATKTDTTIGVSQRLYRVVLVP
jgi:hypothetical protein